ncbi:hypothetical protein [Nocardia cyriacigeorgica]|uniref:DUF4351 domain-containing protein n=1 Tax=Nocardia cyriacigeorgica TaxID=135487 RepID=A0A5R8NL93_9NOCA|nr:hypothetical protein [Nocardia cyriacigeorgica]TLF76448.1 hypothetical protein FEK34_16035 [Nocardia cyriacigeorgica]
MTTAERLMAKGEVRGMCSALLRQLEFKFGQLPLGVVEAVRAADPAELRLWALRVLTASTLDEIFA